MTLEIPFQEFPKIARLSRDCVITEKIDGTNASVFVPEDASEALLFGSRTRWITPEDDNYGFARWATEHTEELRTLGPGHHFGEWWGAGIQRKYGAPFKRFSLFNVGRYNEESLPSCCSLVPVLYRGPFSTEAVEAALEALRTKGSLAMPGFMKPEGVVIYHEAARISFKKTLERDEAPKGVNR